MRIQLSKMFHEVKILINQLIEIAFPNNFELKYSENSDYHNFSEIVEAFIVA